MEKCKEYAMQVNHHLKFFEFQGGYPHRFDLARFEFPGGMFPGSVEEIEEGYQWSISQVDVIAWHRLTDKEEDAA